MQKKIISIKIILLILSLGIFVFLRLWKLNNLFHFTYDEEIIAFVGKRMFLNSHIPLIGGVTPMHVHLAPYFYWTSGIFLYLSKYNPLGWGVISAILSVIALIALYKTSAFYFNKKTGLIAVYIYGLSFYQNILDRHYWGLVFNSLLSLLVLYSLKNLISGKQKSLVLLSGILAYGFHTDPSTLILLVLSIIVIFLYKPVITLRFKILALLIFLGSFSPLVLFDLRHNFSNSRGIFQYLSELKENKSTQTSQGVNNKLLFLPNVLARTLYVYGDKDLAIQYSYCSQHANNRLNQVPIVFSSLITLILVIIFFKLKYSATELLSINILKILFISCVIGVLIYGFLFNGALFDHYLTPVLPGFYIILAFSLSRLLAKNRFLFFVIMSIFIVANVYTLTNAKHRFGFADKTNAVNWAIKQTNNQDFSLDVISSCFKYNGYRYLFFLNGKEPVKSYVDANFTHLYDNPPAKTHPKWLVVITNPNIVETNSYYDEYNKYLTKTINRKSFGNIEVLIVDNSDLDFVGKF